MTLLHDPMIFFYCIYFSVFYNNEILLRKIRDIISFYKFSNRRWNIRDKINNLPSYGEDVDIKFKYKFQIKKIDKLIYKIDTQGIRCLLDRSSPMSQEFLHIVFY